MKMIELEPILTPTTSIKLFQDEKSTLWIPQNNLTVAMGYNKFLSLKYSRLGKFIINANAIKKFTNCNFLDLKKIVEHVLPAFLDGFFREINGSPSRKKFFGNAPVEIFKNTKYLLKLLKEKIMSYDPNSIEAQKGELGEIIVTDILKEMGGEASRSDEYGEKSLMDFLVTPGNDRRFRTRYVEVKVRSTMPYAHGQYPCYSFPVVQIEAYENFCKEKGYPGELWIVDPTDKVVRFARLGYEPDPECIEGLENKKYIDGKEFPFDQETKLGKFRFFHVKQFSEWSGKISALYWTGFARLEERVDKEEVPVESSLSEDYADYSEDCPQSGEKNIEQSSKDLVEKLAAFCNVGKADLVEAVLDLRQKKFDREQEQMKRELLM